MIRVREVSVIGDDGEPLGVKPTEEAIKIAEDQDLDLVPFEEWTPHEPEITSVFTEFMSNH